MYKFFLKIFWYYLLLLIVDILIPTPVENPLIKICETLTIKVENAIIFQNI